MNEIPLKFYLKDSTQEMAAAALGMTQSAVQQMVKAGRDVRVRLDDSGQIVDAYEVKQVGRKKAKRVSAGL